VDHKGAATFNGTPGIPCKVADTRLVTKYQLFVLEVLKAWTDPAQ
jgi:hypothetical protein